MRPNPIHAITRSRVGRHVGFPPVSPVNVPPPSTGWPLVYPGSAIDWRTPHAGAFPSDADSLVALGIPGPTITAAQGTALGGAFATYESQWISYGNQHWTVDGYDWANSNYYDRGLHFIALWLRTGDTTWRDRAYQIIVDYRDNYLVPNSYNSSPHWAQPEGVFLHWWLTGDTASKAAVVGLAEHVSYASFGWPAHDYTEGRIQARCLICALNAWRAGDTSQDWAAQADQLAADQITLQQPDGSYYYNLDPGVYGQSNFMEALRFDALMKYYLWRNRDPAIAACIVKGADYLRATQWDAGVQAFKYWSTDPSTGTSQADLCNLFLTTFGFAYRHTGDASYKTFGDQVMASGVAGAWLDGTKQFNESYFDSWQYLWMRQ